MSEDHGHDGDMSLMRQAAVATHELYQELRRAGFDKSEALTLLSNMLSATFTTTEGEPQPE